MGILEKRIKSLENALGLLERQTVKHRELLQYLIKQHESNMKVFISIRTALTGASAMNTAVLTKGLITNEEYKKALENLINTCARIPETNNLQPENSGTDEGSSGSGKPGILPDESEDPDRRSPDELVDHQGD